jgi:hypothetical protein
LNLKILKLILLVGRSLYARVLTLAVALGC